MINSVPGKRLPESPEAAVDTVEATPPEGKVLRVLFVGDSSMEGAGGAFILVFNEVIGIKL